VVSALLFVVVGGLKERWGSADLEPARAAVREGAPRLGFALIVGLAASLGLPGLAGFWGEFLSVYAAWSPAADRPHALFATVAVVAATGTVLAAAYSLRVARVVWAGDRTEPFIEDGRGHEWHVAWALVAATIALGVAPGPLLALTRDTVSTIIGAAP
jgi:NADH-quinone oxidoreductase subunit M